MSEDSRTFQAEGVPERDRGTTVTRTELWWERLDVFVLAPLRVVWSDWRTRVGSFIILLYVLMGTVGVMYIEPPTLFQGERFTQPQLYDVFDDPGVLLEPDLLLGTNDTGEGLFPKIVHATPPMLKMIVAGAVFSTVMATVIGTVSGYKGGLVDRVLTTLTDIIMTIPGLPLVILVFAIFQIENPYLIGIVLSLNAWAGLARAIRSQVLTLRDQSYVEASRIMNVPTWRILADDVLPNIMPYVLVNFVQSARGVIFGSVALFYLGILPSNVLNWGHMLNRAYGSGTIYSLDMLYWVLAPMIVIIVISFGLILFAQGTERLFNPRIRARHAKTIDDETTLENQ